MPSPVGSYVGSTDGATDGASVEGDAEPVSVASARAAMARSVATLAREWTVTRGRALGVSVRGGVDGDLIMVQN